MRGIRELLNKQYPDTTFFFLAPDITTQVLNFGLAAPIDLQVVGPIGSEDKTEKFANELAAQGRERARRGRRSPRAGRRTCRSSRSRSIARWRSKPG